MECICRALLLTRYVHCTRTDADWTHLRDSDMKLERRERGVKRKKMKRLMHARVLIHIM